MTSSSRPWAAPVYLVLALSLQAVLGCSASAGRRSSDVPAVAVDYTAVVDLLRVRVPPTLEQFDVPGLAVAIVDGSRVVWTEGFGYADLSRRTPLTASTIFSVQSISKSYTALGVLRAVELGDLELDDSILEHLPTFRIQSRAGGIAEVEKITLRRLLSHWASIPHEAPLPTGCLRQDRTFEEHVANLSNAWLIAPVGSRHRYSNLGYDLAGYLLQHKYGKPFPQVMRELVLDPLGMESSTFDQKRALAVRSRAIGYSGRQPRRAEIIPIVPSGALYSNVEDMARFLAHQLTEHTLDGERLVSRDLLREMRTPQFPVERQVSGYGLALVSEKWHGATLVYHDGGGYGYAATQRWMPEYGVGVVVLTNSSSGGSLAGALANRTLELMVRAKTGDWPETTPLQLVDGPAAMLDSVELERVAGTYKPTGNLISFERDGDTLVYIDGGDSVRLRPHAPDVFSAEDRRFTFVFSRAEKPDGVRLLSRSGVAYMPINDYPGAPRGPERPEWSSHVGTYMGAEGRVVEVFRKNGYLYMTYEGELKLAEHESGLFFTAEGESVRLDKDCIVIAGTPFSRRQ